MTEGESAPSAALLLIGDELLSGRTQDANLQQLARLLAGRGIRLKQARVVGDDEDAIVAALDALRSAHDVVLTTGGIGPTHDDITADAVARAFGVEVREHADARRAIEAYAAQRGFAVNADTLRMARIPEGATLIDNPVSAAPGFRLQNVVVMAGVPSIAFAMLDGALDSLPQGALVHSVSVSGYDIGESAVAAPLRKLQADYPGIDIGSYPGKADGRSRLELVARGTDAEQLASVKRALQAILDGALG